MPGEVVAGAAEPLLSGTDTTHVDAFHDDRINTRTNDQLGTASAYIDNQALLVIVSAIDNAGIDEPGFLATRYNVYGCTQN